MELNSYFSDFIEKNKQTLGNTVFDSVTGLIQNQLTNSGVELKSTVVPIAKNEKTEVVKSSMDYSKFLVVGAVLVGAVLVLKAAKKGRV